MWILVRYSKPNLQKLTRSNTPEVFTGKGCIKFTWKHPCQSVISIKLLCNFIEITLRHGCSPVNLLHIFRTPFPRNTSGGLLISSPRLLSVTISTDQLLKDWQTVLRVLRVDRQILRMDRRVLRVDRRVLRGDKWVLRVGKWVLRAGEEHYVWPGK